MEAAPEDGNDGDVDTTDAAAAKDGSNNNETAIAPTGGYVIYHVDDKAGVAVDPSLKRHGGSNNNNNNRGVKNVAEDDAESAIRYDDVVPFLLAQHEGKEHKAFPTFAEAVDEYFSKIESQKMDARRAQQEQNAVKKLEMVKQSQAQRLAQLERVQEENLAKARAIEGSMDVVDAAINVIRSALANSVDWSDLWQIVKDEQHAGDPVAGIIHRLKLDTNTISLLLTNTRDDCEDEDDITAPMLTVDVDVGLSAQGNASRFYAMKKKHGEKHVKAAEAAAVAVKKQQKKTVKALQEVQVKQVRGQSIYLCVEGRGGSFFYFFLL